MQYAISHLEPVKGNRPVKRVGKIHSHSFGSEGAKLNNMVWNKLHTCRKQTKILYYTVCLRKY